MHSGRILCCLVIFSMLGNNSIPRQLSLPDIPNYASVRIGRQVWMTNNWDLPMPHSWYYDNDSTPDTKYGRLYYFSNAVAAAPPGWHLPTLNEWWELIDTLGGYMDAGKRLMEDSIDSTGPGLVFGGYKSANISPEDLFGFKDTQAYYWTSTPDGDQTAYAIHVRKSTHELEINSYRRANGFSVRYIKDSN